MTADALRTVAVDALTRIAPELRDASLRHDMPLRDQVDLDSMDFLNFVIALHERTGIDIPEADYPRLSTIDAIAAYLAARAGPGKEQP
jgi:acyl carrier protein